MKHPLWMIVEGRFAVQMHDGKTLESAGKKNLDARRRYMTKEISEMAIEMQDEGLDARSEEFGDMVISCVTLPAHFDGTAIVSALPGGVCPIPHWGRVMEGEIHLRYADGSEEVTRAGEFFHWPPGHTIWTEDTGVVWMDVAPTKDTRRVNELLGL